MQEEFERKQRKKKRDEELANENDTQSSDNAVSISPDMIRIRDEKLQKAKEAVRK